MSKIILISRVKNQIDSYEDLCVKIGDKEYSYSVLSYAADKFEWMLKKKMGFNAINYLKREAED